MHTPRSSANGMNHTCLCLPSRSWYSFTDPEGMEGWVDQWAVSRTGAQGVVMTTRATRYWHYKIWMIAPPLPSVRGSAAFAPRKKNIPIGAFLVKPHLIYHGTVIVFWSWQKPKIQACRQSVKYIGNFFYISWQLFYAQFLDYIVGFCWSSSCTRVCTYTVSPKKLSRFVFVRTSSNFHQFR